MLRRMSTKKNNQPLNELTKLIFKRRSIYPAMFSGKSIDDQIVSRLLENANQAPTHKQTEPWRFHVISGLRLDKLTQFLQETYKAYTPPDEFKLLKYQKFASKLKKTSHVIVICMQRHSNSKLPEWEEIAAVACAIQNLYLSVTAEELGGYWSSPGLMIQHIHKFIQMEENEKCLGFFYLGVPIDGLNLQIKKGNLSEKVKWYR